MPSEPPPPAYCPACGHRRGASGAVCADCGGDLRKRPAGGVVYCPACGELNLAEAAVCKSVRCPDPLLWRRFGEAPPPEPAAPGVSGRRRKFSLLAGLAGAALLLCLAVLWYAAGRDGADGEGGVLLTRLWYGTRHAATATPPPDRAAPTPQRPAGGEAAQPTGDLLIEVSPSPAEVYVDAHWEGRAPVTVRDLSPREYEVRVEKEGYAARTETVTLQTGILNRAYFKLDRARGGVELTSYPPGAAVWIDGVDTLKKTPARLGEIEIGNHVLTLRLEGYDDRDVGFTVRTDETTRLGEIALNRGEATEKVATKQNAITSPYREKALEEFDKKPLKEFYRGGGGGGGMKIKLATLAPEGTTWANKLEDAAQEIRRKTNGRVKLKLYWGGTKGEEVEMMEKLKIGEIDAVAVTGMGLGKISKEIRVMDLPLLFDNYTEFDYVRNKLFNRFTNAFEKEGYLLLGMSETGFIYVFSNKPIRELSDMQGVKMWAYKGEPVSQAMVEALKMNAVPLGITDVLTSLQTGLIDAFYAPPLGAIALQWHTKTKYISSLPIANAAAGIVMRKDTFDKLIPKDQKILLVAIYERNAELVTALSRDNEEAREELVPALRRDNEKAREELLTKYGLQESGEPTPEGLQEMKKAAETVKKRLLGEYYSQDLLNEVEKLVKECRAMGQEKCREKINTGP